MIFRGDFGRFRPIQVIFVVREPLCDVRENPLLSPNNFTSGYLMKTELLLANETPVGSPDRAKPDILGMILNVFWPIQAVWVEGEPLCAVGIPS